MTDAFVRLGRGALRRAASGRDLRRRTPPEIRYDAGAAVPGTVYYLSPDDNVPSGGIRMLYRHVDLLNATGRAAAILHAGRGFRADWFVNDTRVLSARDVTLGPADLLVQGLREALVDQGEDAEFSPTHSATRCWPLCR